MNSESPKSAPQESFYDLSGRYKALEAITDHLSKSVDLAVALFHAYPDAVVVAEGDGGRVILANKQAEFLFGRSIAELQGMVVEELMPEERRERHVNHRTEYMLNPSPRAMGVELDTRALRKNGREIPVFISLAPVVLPEGVFIVVALRPKAKWATQQ